MVPEGSVPVLLSYDSQLYARFDEDLSKFFMFLFFLNTLVFVIIDTVCYIFTTQKILIGLQLKYFH